MPNFVMRIVGLVAASTVATYVTTLLFFVAASLQGPLAPEIMLLPFAALLGILFGFAGAALFLAAAFLLAEGFGVQRWMYAPIGLGTGFAHSMVALALFDENRWVGYAWITGSLLADIAANVPWGPTALFPATGVAGILAGRTYARIVFGPTGTRSGYS